MTTKAHYIPAGYHTVTPYLIIRDAARAIEFYQQAFGATEVLRMPMPDGKVGHAEIKIGDSHIMLADETPHTISRSPATYGGSPVSMCLYVEDCDAMLAKATTLGATYVKPLQDQFYGDRSGTIMDPFGHTWTVATHKEDLTMEDIEKRMAAGGCAE